MIALIAGRGSLPAAVVSALSEPPLVVAFEGATPEGLSVDIRFRLETLGSLIAALQARGVTSVCMAGGIARPRVDPSLIDAATLPLVPVIAAALEQGDDGALRAVIGIFERAGLAVRAAHEIAPALLPPPGVPTEAQPDTAARNDAARGARIVEAMAVADVGQACVAWRGQALAVEATFGTDWMLASLANRADDGRGGVLYKGPKAGQDRRVDLPVIGPATVVAAADAGLSGVVIEAGGVMVLQAERVVAACDRLGLFLWVRERG
ncbi:MAG: UDP-2,3-diacylglucosamine diphosphatase LpxI [Rhodobacteraceae bacterium]|nr:UDP-2,3-diacylglucosamine diphosphatase LpxI [Paracoccaceae bacterium]